MRPLTRALIARAAPSTVPSPTPSAPDEARLRAEMKVFLRGRDPSLGLWVFAYGALMWDHAEAAPDIVAPARLPGLARRYDLLDRRDRGTAAVPSLTLGLEGAPGLACPGLLLHLPGAAVEGRLWPVWRQEMACGFYDPQWREARLTARPNGGAPVRALCFVTRQGNPLHRPGLGIGAAADVLARASGPNGAAASYLLDAAETLRRNGMRDALLESLEAEVARRLETPSASAA